MTVFGISFEETRQVAEQWMTQSDTVGGISFDGLSSVTGEHSRVAAALSSTGAPATSCALSIATRMSTLAENLQFFTTRSENNDKIIAGDFQRLSVR